MSCIDSCHRSCSSAPSVVCLQRLHEWCSAERPAREWHRYPHHIWLAIATLGWTESWSPTQESLPDCLSSCRSVPSVYVHCCVTVAGCVVVWSLYSGRNTIGPVAVLFGVLCSVENLRGWPVYGWWVFEFVRRFRFLKIKRTKNGEIYLVNSI